MCFLFNYAPICKKTFLNSIFISILSLRNEQIFPLVFICIIKNNRNILNARVLGNTLYIFSLTIYYTARSNNFVYVKYLRYF